MYIQEQSLRASHRVPTINDDVALIDIVHPYLALHLHLLVMRYGLTMNFLITTLLLVCEHLINPQTCVAMRDGDITHWCKSTSLYGAAQDAVIKRCRELVPTTEVLTIIYDTIQALPPKRFYVSDQGYQVWMEWGASLEKEAVTHGNNFQNRSRSEFLRKAFNATVSLHLIDAVIERNEPSEEIPTGTIKRGIAFGNWLYNQTRPFDAKRILTDRDSEGSKFLQPVEGMMPASNNQADNDVDPEDRSVTPPDDTLVIPYPQQVITYTPFRQAFSYTKKHLYELEREYYEEYIHRFKLTEECRCFDVRTSRNASICRERTFREVLDVLDKNKGARVVQLRTGPVSQIAVLTVKHERAVKLVNEFLRGYDTSLDELLHYTIGLKYHEKNPHHYSLLFKVTNPENFQRESFKKIGFGTIHLTWDWYSMDIWDEERGGWFVTKKEIQPIPEWGKDLMYQIKQWKGDLKHVTK